LPIQIIKNAFLGPATETFMKLSLRRTLIHLGSNAAFTEAKIEAYKQFDETNSMYKSIQNI